MDKSMYNSIDEINKYIEDSEPTIVQTYRPKYHMSPRVGWMNDPNGLIYKDGTYHLYYQANPFGVEPGKMLWSHFVSKDLIEYKDLGVALCPTEKGENAFSGGAIEINNEFHIYYTLHVNKKEPHVVRIDGKDKNLMIKHSLNEVDNEACKHEPRIVEDESDKSEEVYHSISMDGMRYETGKKVFDNSTLPENYSRIDFRDPSPIMIDGDYYLFLGGRDMKLDQGLIVVLKAKDLDHYEYDFTIGPFKELGFMGECPCFRRVGNKDVLIASGCSPYRDGNNFKNMNSSVFIVGKLDLKNKKMDVDYIKEIDKGDSFYAPQFISGTEEPTMIGWFEMWEKHYPTKRLGHGWVGAFSIPRVLKEKDGQIYQTVIPSLYDYLKDCKGDKVPKCSRITVTLEENAKLVIAGDNGEVVIGNNEEGVYVDNTLCNSLYKCIRRTNESYKEAHLEILLDVSGLEVFVENGLEVISTRIYLDGELKITTQENIKDLNIKEVVTTL